MVADPQGAVAGMYRDIAMKLAVAIASKNKDFSGKFPTITVSKST